MTEDGKVLFGAFNFTESTILANMYAQAAASGGVPALVVSNVGPREAIYDLLFAGAIGALPEYSGSAVIELGGTATADETATHDELIDLMKQKHVAVLAAAPAVNSDAVAVTLDTATRFDLRTMSDLAPHAADLAFAGPSECPQRPLCIPGFKDRYGITFKSFVPIDAGLASASALARNEVGAARVFTTDATISVFALVVLTDDKGLYPAENVTPVVRQDVLDKYPELSDALDKVSAALTTRDLLALNYTVAIGGQLPEVAAKAWLQDNSLIPKD
jgi:osmoprotectant transport system substrate-binding protein